MVFQFVDVSKNTTLSINSVKIYKSLLNRISKEGFETQDSLIENSDKILEYIKENYETNAKQRQIICAIFYILCDTEYLKSSNPYYDYFLTIKSG
jgi:hypothetical protein